VVSWALQAVAWAKLCLVQLEALANQLATALLMLAMVLKKVATVLLREPKTLGNGNLDHRQKPWIMI
jgi:hypothetical protein